MAVRMANISDTLPSVVDGLPKMYRWGLAWFGGGDPPEIITLVILICTGSILPNNQYNYHCFRNYDSIQS
jgi:hypothetical protein